MSLVEVNVDGAVATLLLNRPEARNALSAEVCRELVVALDGVDRLPDVRALLVRGEGKTFCAGADIAAVSGPGALEFLPAFEAMLDSLARHRVPTIAVIQGAALGGGLQLATVCDFRIAAQDALLGIPSSRLGIVVNFENVQRLVLLVGVALAKEILMAGRSLSGRDAAKVGLVNEAMEADALDERAGVAAGEIARLAPLSVQGAKAAIQLVMDSMGASRARDASAIEDHDDLLARAYESEDLAEGLRALAAKRTPRFRGR